MWADAVDDEKLKLLAFEDRWHFIAILCCKRKGILDAPDAAALRDRKVGAKLGLADRERDEVRRRLTEVSLIDENWQPLAWQKRQFTSDEDPTANERKKRQREKQRHARVTRDNRDSHAPVTDASRTGHTAQSQIQTTDSEKKPSLRSGGAQARPRAKRCPPEFAITPEMREWARAEAPGLDIDRETAALKDHEFRTAHTDWLAVWRQWMRRAPEFKRNGGTGVRQEKSSLTWRPDEESDHA